MSTTDKQHSRWNHNKKSCAHINRNSTHYRRTDTEWQVCVWKRDRGRHTVRWVRSNPRMETKNTSVHVRHVKEDTSWHLMPGKKITLLLYASKYWHFSILLIRTIKFSSQTLSAILLNTKHYKGTLTLKQAGHAKWNQILYLLYTFWTLQQFSAAYLNIPLISHAHNTLNLKCYSTHKQTNTHKWRQKLKNIYPLSHTKTHTHTT